MDIANLDVVCTICQNNRLLIPAAEITGMKPGDLMDAIEKHPTFVTAKWAVRDHPDPRIRRYVICPDCLDGVRKSVRNLQPFAKDAVCPKCGGNNLACEYRSGAERDSLIPLEHIQRTCAMCKYRFAQATLDKQLDLGERRE